MVAVELEAAASWLTKVHIDAAVERFANLAGAVRIKEANYVASVDAVPYAKDSAEVAAS